MDSLNHFRGLAKSLIERSYYAGIAAPAALYTNASWVTIGLVTATSYLIHDRAISIFRLGTRDILIDDEQPLSKNQLSHIEVEAKSAALETFFWNAVATGLAGGASKMLGLSAFSTLSSLVDPYAWEACITGSSWWAVPLFIGAGIVARKNPQSAGECYDSIERVFRTEYTNPQVPPKCAPE